MKYTGDSMSDFVRATAIRAVRTIAQTAVALIGTATVIEAVDWQLVASAALLAGLLSILTTIGTGIPEAPGSGLIHPDHTGPWTTDHEGDDG